MTKTREFINLSLSGSISPMEMNLHSMYVGCILLQQQRHCVPCVPIFFYYSFGYRNNLPGRPPKIQSSSEGFFVQHTERENGNMQMSARETNFHFLFSLPFSSSMAIFLPLFRNLCAYRVCKIGSRRETKD